MDSDSVQRKGHQPKRIQALGWLKSISRNPFAIHFRKPPSFVRSVEIVAVVNLFGMYAIAVLVIILSHVGIIVDPRLLRLRVLGIIKISYCGSVWWLVSLTLLRTAPSLTAGMKDVSGWAWMCSAIWLSCSILARHKHNRTEDLQSPDASRTSRHTWAILIYSFSIIFPFKNNVPGVGNFTILLHPLLFRWNTMLLTWLDRHGLGWGLSEA